MDASQWQTSILLNGPVPGWWNCSLSAFFKSQKEIHRAVQPPLEFHHAYCLIVISGCEHTQSPALL